MYSVPARLIYLDLLRAVSATKSPPDNIRDWPLRVETYFDPEKHALYVNSSLYIDNIGWITTDYYEDLNNSDRVEILFRIGEEEKEFAWYKLDPKGSHLLKCLERALLAAELQGLFHQKIE